jgi:hypothetical protein
VSNIIVPVGICAKKSINLSSPGRCDRVGRTAAWPLVLHPGVASGLIIHLIDDGGQCYFLDNGERIRRAE